MAKFKNKLGYLLTFVTTVLSGAISAQDQPEPKAAEDKAEAAKKAELRIDISAPTPEAPSMTMALQNYIKATNGKK